MRFSLLAVMAVAAEARHHHHHHDYGYLQSEVMGIDKKTLQPDQHWRGSWPQGPVDDSTDDDKILNWMRKPKEPEPPIRYHDQMRQWQAGTWPVHHTWDDDWTKASYHNEIDDGTDDNEVVALQVRRH